MTLRSRFLLLAATTCLAPAAARAGGFNVARYGGEHGHAASDSVTSLYFNPAGLALGAGWRIYAEGIFALRHVSYDRPELAIDNVLDPGDSGAGTPVDAMDTNSGQATLTNFLTNPFIGAATDFGVPNLGVGIGFYVPFGGQAKWDKNDKYVGDTQYPGAEDGVQRWHTIEGEIRSLYFTVGGAYRLPGPRLSFGAGFNLIRSNVDTVRARTAAGTDDIVTADGDLVEGRSHIDVSGTAASVSAGVIWQPVDNVWIGASYQSEPGFGNNTQSGTLTNKLGLTGVEDTPVRLEQELPDVTRVAARYQPMPQVELRLSGDFQRWSVFDNQCFLDGNMDKSETNCALNSDGSPGAGAQGIIINIPRYWKNTFGVRGGGSYWFTPDFEVNAGLSYDSSAVPDKTIDSSLLDQNKVITHTGLRWGLMPGKLILDFSLNYVFYFNRSVDPRERDEADMGIGPLPPSSIPDGAGTYKQSVIYSNVGMEYMF